MMGVSKEVNFLGEICNTVATKSYKADAEKSFRYYTESGLLSYTFTAEKYS